MKNDLKVILASASPRRKELLKMLVEDFEVIPADIDESISADIMPIMVAENIAIKKSQAIKRDDALIIACDTVVIIHDKILGKPRDADEAFFMLKSLSGETHSVVTGVCLQYKGKPHSFSEMTTVRFFELSDDEISEYIKTGEPFDKAGAYGIQGRGGLLVKGIEGDFYNVVGLPVSRLKREIDEFLKAL